NNPENNVVPALTESIAVSDGTVSLGIGTSRILTESIAISDGTVSAVFTNNPESIVIPALTESVGITAGFVQLKNITAGQELITSGTVDVDINPIAPEIVIANGSPSNITISSAVTEPKINYNERLVSDTDSQGTAIKTVTIEKDMEINSDFTGDAVYDFKVSFETNTIIAGPATWDGVFNLPTIKESTSVTISDTTSSTESGATSTTTTTTRVVESVIEIGLDDIILTFNQAVRLEFTGKTGLDAFFERGGAVTIITTECDADSQSAADSQLGDGEECKFDNKTDLIIWTKHFTRFGTASSSSSSTSTASSFAQSAGSSSGTGTGPGSSGASGFGVILFTPLKIHEITYDVCSENMATILVANDDATVPTVTLQTTKSGTVEAVLAAEQPFAEKNEFTTIDRYLFLAPLDPKETYMMVQLKAVDGIRVNSVNSAVHMTECQGVIQFDEQPVEFEGINFAAPRIFDVKVQIDNGTAQSAISPETPYLDEQELTVSAIVNSQVPLQRAELRYIIAGQPADDYIAFLMDITPIEGVDTAVKVSASIPPMFMAAPGIEYWIHVMDVNLDDRASQHYTMGVKPSYDVDASIELDIPTSKPEGSILRPSVYVMNDSPEAAFGIVSLLVNGKVVSSTSSFFKPGEIVVPLEWSIPKEGRHLIYTVQAKLDFYDVSVTTEKAYVSSFMKTQIVSLSEMQSIQPLTGKSGNTVAEPALLYASDSQHDNLRFRVIGDDGFCFIGATEECAVKDSTLNKRGGIESVEHDGIIYRVKYSGADSPLERFSITSVDQVSTNWNITLESTDDFIPQAFAMQDVHLKVKYRTISEMTTVSSE
ncbi:MAG: hypothetical protein IIA83_02060, partial [Thaumarchaeota archaeon]|nr:hypothetical protein [Nitrososphaerota archaeon]